MSRCGLREECVGLSRSMWPAPTLVGNEYGLGKSAEQEAVKHFQFEKYRKEKKLVRQSNSLKESMSWFELWKSEKLFQVQWANMLCVHKVSSLNSATQTSSMFLPEQQINLSCKGGNIGLANSEKVSFFLLCLV